MLHIMMILDRMADKFKSEEGAGMAEYTLLLVLIAIACIGFFQGLAGAIGSALAGVVTALN